LEEFENISFDAKKNDYPDLEDLDGFERIHVPIESREFKTYKILRRLD